MRSRTFPSSTLALLLLAGCHGYKRSSAPIAPSAELVRIRFAQPREMVIARDDPRDGWSDTLDNVASAEGSVMEMHGDTLRLALTQFSRNRVYRQVPLGRHAVIVMSAGTRVERRGISVTRTAFAGLGVVVLVALAAGALYIIGMSMAYDS